MTYICRAVAVSAPGARATVPREAIEAPRGRPLAMPQGSFRAPRVGEGVPGAFAPLQGAERLRVIARNDASGAAPMSPEGAAPPKKVRGGAERPAPRAGH